DRAPHPRLPDPRAGRAGELLRRRSARRAARSGGGAAERDRPQPVRPRAGGSGGGLRRHRVLPPVARPGRRVRERARPRGLPALRRGHPRRGRRGRQRAGRAGDARHARLHPHRGGTGPRHDGGPRPRHLRRDGALPPRRSAGGEGRPPAPRLDARRHRLRRHRQAPCGDGAGAEHARARVRPARPRRGPAHRPGGAGRAAVPSRFRRLPRRGDGGDREPDGRRRLRPHEARRLLPQPGAGRLGGRGGAARGARLRAPRRRRARRRPRAGPDAHARIGRAPARGRHAPRRRPHATGDPAPSHGHGAPGAGARGGAPARARGQRRGRAPLGAARHQDL
ncbi:MAG: D-3-phosphoglycerate dehydrogenase, partial [uncultured Acetobacteraceae bacterium]